MQQSTYAYVIKGKYIHSNALFSNYYKYITHFRKREFISEGNIDFRLCILFIIQKIACHFFMYLSFIVFPLLSSLLSLDNTLLYIIYVTDWQWWKSIEEEYFGILGGFVRVKLSNVHYCRTLIYIAHVSISTNNTQKPIIFLFSIKKYLTISLYSQ